MSMPPAQSAYTCPYCGAPVDVRLKISDSGWIEQPPIRDMARIRFSRSTCQISGEYVPVAETGLHDDDWVYFSHHVLLHCDPMVRFDNMPMKGAWKRMRAGMPLVMMRAQGPGHIAFSADHPGETLAVPLVPGRAIDVAEHHFLVATGNVNYDWKNCNVWFTKRDDDSEEWHYPLGQTLDKFTATGTNGLL